MGRGCSHVVRVIYCGDTMVYCGDTMVWSGRAAVKRYHGKSTTNMNKVTTNSLQQLTAILMPFDNGRSGRMSYQKA
jgi:hypothetical protein